MTLFRLELSQGRLVFKTEDDNFSRPFGDDDRQALREFCQRYRKLRERPAAASLLELGRSLFKWFDGETDWGAQLDEFDPPYLLEIGAKRRPTDDERLLLDAPWEILADARGYWCARQYGPHRRLGKVKASDAGIEQEPLSVLFMAADPNGETPLGYELEEAAILNATKHAPLDLYVEDTGTASELGDQYRRLSSRGAVQVVHISCHGKRGTKPVLLLEDEIGERDDVDAAGLTEQLSARQTPQLVFVSACNTAADPERKDMSEIYTRALVGAGIPAGLGWAASVRDSSATKFARQLYSHLAGGLPLEVGVVHARKELLAPKQGTPADDWHMARLVLGRTGGGVLAHPDARRKLLRETDKAFLDADGQVRVAGPGQFVGRRKQLQDIVREFRKDNSHGVLIHGFGRQGKSSLALRVIQRFEGRLKRVVMFKDYSSWRLIELLAQALPADVGERWKQTYPKAADDAPTLEVALRALFEGPCKQRGDGKEPLLLVIDDLERILEPTERNDGRYAVQEEYIPTLRAVFRAFRDSPSDSRLLLTSRFRFFLPDHDGTNLAEQVLELQLPPMTTDDARKQVNAIGFAGDSKETKRQAIAHSKLIDRCIAASKGNPGLLDLLLRLLHEDPTRCTTALDEMARVESSGEMPTDSKLLEFFQRVAVKALVDLLEPGERHLLRASTLFESGIPFPTQVIPAIRNALFVGEDISAERLVSLGLWEQMSDVVDRKQAALAINGVVRLWVSTDADTGGELSDDERKLLAGATLPGLTECWGSLKSGQASPAAMQLVLLALQVEDTAVLAEYGAGTLRWLEGQMTPADAAKIAVVLIAMLDQANVPVPLNLLFRATRFARSLDGKLSLEWSARAVAQLEGVTPSPDEEHVWAAIWMDRGDILGRSGDPTGAQYAFEQSLIYLSQSTYVRGYAILRGRIANICHTRGLVDEAMRILQDELLPVFERLGDVRSRALTMANIANIYQTRGQVDEALRILRDELLPVFDRHGDVHQRAVTMGQIADIYQARGQLDEALCILRDELLPVFDRLGDVRSRALTMGKISDIYQARGQLDEALFILQDELLPVYDRLGDVRSRAVTMGQIADIYQARGQLDEALRIRQDDLLPVYEHLGDVHQRAVTMGRIADIYQAHDQLDEALRIRQEEELPVYERRGDVHQRAVTMGQIAEIYQARGQLDNALRIFQDEVLPVYDRLGDVRSRAVTMGQIADIYQASGQCGEALRILQDEVLPVFDRLGDVRSLLIAKINLATLLLPGASDDVHKAMSLLADSLADARRCGFMVEAKQIERILGRLGVPSQTLGQRAATYVLHALSVCRPAPLVERVGPVAFRRLLYHQAKQLVPALQAAAMAQGNLGLVVDDLEGLLLPGSLPAEAAAQWSEMTRGLSELRRDFSKDYDAFAETLPAQDGCFDISALSQQWMKLPEPDEDDWRALFDETLAVLQSGDREVLLGEFALWKHAARKMLEIVAGESSTTIARLLVEALPDKRAELLAAWEDVLSEEQRLVLGDT